MGKKWAVIAAGLLIAVSGSALAAGVNGEYKGHPIVNVVVNGKAVHGDVPGINMDGTTLVPLRVVSESLGARVEWDSNTSTASVALALPSPESGQKEQASQKLQADENKLKAYRKLAELSEKTADYVNHLPNVRERIRIAKEFYDIRKHDYRIVSMNQGYWKEFNDCYNQIIAGLAELQDEATRYGIDRIEWIKAIEQAHSAFAAYKSSVDHLNQLIATGQSQFLEFYILSYSQGFDEELKAKEMVDSLLKHETLSQARSSSNEHSQR